MSLALSAGSCFCCCVHAWSGARRLHIVRVTAVLTGHLLPYVTWQWCGCGKWTGAGDGLQNEASVGMKSVCCLFRKHRASSEKGSDVGWIDSIREFGVLEARELVAFRLFGFSCQSRNGSHRKDACDRSKSAAARSRTRPQFWATAIHLNPYWRVACMIFVFKSIPTSSVRHDLLPPHIPV